MKRAIFREAKPGQSPAKPPMRSLHEVTNVEASLRSLRGGFASKR